MMRGVWHIVRRTASEFQDDKCPQLAAAIAYHVLFSMIPVVALIVAALGFMVRVPTISQEIIGHVLAAVPMRSGLVVDAIRAVSQASEPLTIAGLLGLVWAALGLFGSVRDSLNTAWDVTRQRGFVREKLLDVGSLLGLGLLLGGSIIGTTALHTVRNVSGKLLGHYSQPLERVWDAIAWTFPAAITFLAFLLLYRYIPYVRHGFRDVWPGALVAALLFEGGKHAFTFYVANFNRYEAVYGALGTVMIFLTWVYLSSLILLIGAEVASVYEETRRPAQTARRKERLAEEERAKLDSEIDPGASR